MPRGLRAQCSRRCRPLEHTGGGTAELNAFGRRIIALTMFIGRVGPISLALALALALGSSRPSQITFPKAKLMVD